MTAASLRARVRAEMTGEIKAVARRHLATDGANLSLRAVARELGMVSSAVYRYFGSRDELLTALIIDAYDALATAAETAEATVDRADLLGRWLACGHAVRDWALGAPHEYALIYGSPVPGYHAPRDTVAPAVRAPALIGAILRDLSAAGRQASPSGASRSLSGASPGSAGAPPLDEPLRAELAAIRDRLAPGVSESLLARGLTAWIHVFGAVSFELFGQLDNGIDDRRAFFDLQLRVLAGVIGIGSAR